MNPPIPSSVCQKEMQDVGTDEVIVEFVTDSKGNEVKDLNLFLSNLNQIKHMFNIYPVKMNYLLFQKRNSIRQGKLQLIPIVSLYHLMMKQVMIGQ